MTREELIEAILQEFDPVSAAIVGGVATGWAARKALNRYSPTFAKKAARADMGRAQSAQRLKKSNYLGAKKYWAKREQGATERAVKHTERAQHLLKQDQKYKKRRGLSR